MRTIKKLRIYKRPLNIGGRGRGYRGGYNGGGIRMSEADAVRLGLIKETPKPSSEDREQFWRKRKEFTWQHQEQERQNRQEEKWAENRERENKREAEQEQKRKEQHRKATWEKTKQSFRKEGRVARNTAKALRLW